MNKHEAILKLHPNVVTIRGDVAYDKDENEVVYDKNAVQTEIDNNEYKDKRRAEYPLFTEQLDYIYHNGIEAWKTDMIMPVKNKYPKEDK
jgi:hypothetical protein